MCMMHFEYKTSSFYKFIHKKELTISLHDVLCMNTLILFKVLLSIIHQQYVTNHEKLCHKLKILKIVFLVQLECADYNHCHGVAVS